MIAEAAVQPDKAAIHTREREAFFPTYDRLPIGVIESAEGCVIRTQDGIEYLDCIAGLGVNALGHSHPAIIAAINDQAKKYLHLSNLYVQEPQLLLAEKLKELSGFDRVFLTNSGTEAVEGAIKLARKYHGDSAKVAVVGMANGFHGRTYGPLSVMDQEKYRGGFGPFLPECSNVSYSTEAIAQAVGPQTAAVIVEPIQGEGGIVEISADVVELLHKLREKFGFLLIVDEIQSGFGRTGKFFAFEHYGLQPDIVVCAKAIGGGLPLGAILSSSEIASKLASGSHGTTFGGNALACAAGNVVLEKLAGGLMDEVVVQGEYLHEQLVALKRIYPSLIENVRGKGLMLGFSVSCDAKHIQKRLLEEHVIVNVTAGNVIRLLPPLVISHEHARRLVEALSDVVEEYELR